MPVIKFSPLPFTALAYLAGTITLFQLSALDAVWSIIGVLPFVMLLLLRIRTYRLPLLFFLLGFLWTGFLVNQQLSVSLHKELNGKEVIVDGVIEGLPVREGRVVRFTLNVFRTAESDAKKISGKIRVSDYRKDSIDPQPGEAWRLLLRVKSPHGFANPAGFDYEKWLFSQHIIATAYIRKNKTDIPGVNLRIPSMDRSAVIDRMRLRIASQIKNSLPDSSFRGIITALATGDRRAITTQQWSVLQSTGTSHLMAISGLHVGLVAGIAFFLFRFLFAAIPQFPLYVPAHVMAIVVAMFFAVFYSLMAGFSLPTQRALLMLTVLMVSIILQRHVRALDILSLTLLLVLIVDPGSILSAGFWLSFAAVSMIMYILLRRRHKNKWAGKRIVETIRLQWMLSLMMAPATLIFFQQIPLTGPVANIIAIPIVAFFVVPLVLLASLSFLILGRGVVEQSLYQLAEYIIQILWQILDPLARATESISTSYNQSHFAIVGLLFAVFIFMLPAGLKIKNLALIGLLLFIFPSREELAEGEFKVILLDVGQGLSTLVMTNRHALLFDVGARFSKRFNAGDAVVLPVLKSLSIRKLDTIIVSHGDNDHSGGLEKVLNGMEVGQIMSSQDYTDVKSTACKAGMQWQWEGVNFKILHPDDESNATGNNASCVLHIQSAFASVLIPADIEKKAEQEIISRYPDALKSSVLIAPHHGSNTSSSDEFLDAVSPEVVLFPAGWMNRYRHPANKVLTRLSKRKIMSMVTGECGAITVHVAAKGLIINAWRQSNSKIWNVNELERRCSKIAVGLSESPVI